jgi:hypothetical protein
MIRPLFAALCLFLAAAAPASAQSSAQPVDLALEGMAVNVSVGVAAGVSMTIRGINTRTVTASGDFDNRNLVGRFQAAGRELPCSDGHTCLQFQGVLLGLEAGGFDEGTAATYIMTLSIPADGSDIDGVFVLGPLPSFDYEQHGLLRLRVAR